MAKYKIFGTTSKELTLPTTKPETSLDFVNSQCIDPSYTFTRNSSGTYVGDDGLIKTAAINEPRFEFDPVTGEFKGLLIEEQRTNSYANNHTYAYRFINNPSTGGWQNAVGASTDNTQFTGANATVTTDLPGGVIGTAARATLNGSNAIASFQFDGISFSAGILSTYIRSNKSCSVGWGTENSFQFFDLQANVWTRVFAVLSSSPWGGAVRNLRANSRISNISGGYPVTFDLCFVQQENGINLREPTSYIPTSGSTVTRQPDQLVLNRTLNPQGAFYIESSTDTNVSTLVADNGSSVLVPPQGTKSALFYNTSRTLSMSSSITPFEGNYNVPQNLNRVSLGFDRLNNSSYINGHLKKFMYYGSPVTEDNLRSLTGNIRPTFRFDREQIVTDGLVLNLDAGNPASYPGSGTTWSDLSGNGKNGTLLNGVGYSGDNGGSLVFDRVDDYVVLTNSYSSPSLPTGSSPRTLISCFKTGASFGFPYEHIIHYGSAATDQAYGITLYNISGSYYITNHTWSGTSYFTNYPVSTNTIYFVAVTYNDTSTPRNTFFVNGTFGTTGFSQGKVADYSINTGTGFQLHLGTRVSPGEYFGGSIYFTQVYNKALTASEIQQNFNAIRSRYGI
jgi:hypothetical protein